MNEGLLRLLAKAYMRGHSHGRNNNAPPNPKVAVEALLTEVVEYHTEAFGPSPDTAHLPARSTPAEALDVETLARLWREEEVTDLDVDCPKVDYEATAAAVMDRLGAALHRHWGVHHWGMDGRCIYPGCSFVVTGSPHNREADHE